MPEYRNGPDFQNFSSNEDRVYVAPHVGAPDGRPVNVQPAYSVIMGQMRLNDPDVLHTTVTLMARNGPWALTFLPTADEMDILAEHFTKEAKRMRARADAQAAAAINRAMKG